MPIGTARCSARITRTYGVDRQRLVERKKKINAADRQYLQYRYSGGTMHAYRPLAIAYRLERRAHLARLPQIFLGMKLQRELQSF